MERKCKRNGVFATEGGSVENCDDEEGLARRLGQLYELCAGVFQHSLRMGDLTEGGFDFTEQVLHGAMRRDVRVDGPNPKSLPLRGGDCLVGLSRLVHRLDLQFVIQNLLADGILLECPGSIAGVELTMHQGAVDMFLQWIKVKQAVTKCNGGLPML